MLDSLSRRSRIRMEAVLALAAIASVGRWHDANDAARIAPKAPYQPRTWHWKWQHGEQEMARRRRQIASGMLTTSNGLNPRQKARIVDYLAARYCG